MNRRHLIKTTALAAVAPLVSCTPAVEPPYDPELLPRRIEDLPGIKIARVREHKGNGKGPVYAHRVVEFDTSGVDPRIMDAWDKKHCPRKMEFHIKKNGIKQTGRALADYFDQNFTDVPV